MLRCLWMLKWRDWREENMISIWDSVHVKRENIFNCKERSLHVLRIPVRQSDSDSEQACASPKKYKKRRSKEKLNNWIFQSVNLAQKGDYSIHAHRNVWTISYPMPFYIIFNHIFHHIDRFLCFSQLLPLFGKGGLPPTWVFVHSPLLTNPKSIWSHNAKKETKICHPQRAPIKVHHPPNPQNPGDIHK